MCKSSQSPWRAEFFYLHGAPQQVPILTQSRCCCSHCAQPPSNLEVNPPQTSASMPCFLWLPACMFSTDFSSARCICPICGGLHTESLNLLHFRAVAQQSIGKENWANSVAPNFSSKHWKLASSMSSNIFTLTLQSLMDCSDWTTYDLVK